VLAPNEWLAGGSPEFDTFDSLCAMAHVTYRIGAKYNGNRFPFDLILKAGRSDGSGTAQPPPFNAELFEKSRGRSGTKNEFVWI